MKMELYFAPPDVEKFKNGERVFAYAFPMTGSKLKMLIDITKVKMEASEHGLYVQRYSSNGNFGPR